MHQKLSVRGFTLIQMIIAIAVFAILLTTIFISAKPYIRRAHDQEKIAALDRFKKGLALYHQQEREYPPLDQDAHGHDKNQYEYVVNPIQNSATCDVDPNLGSESFILDGGFAFDNSFSHPGIIEGNVIQGLGAPLFNEYDIRTYDDEHENSSSWNCRYIIDDKWHGTDFESVQRYYIHCRLDYPNEASRNDGGLGFYQQHFYEVFEPNPWICIRCVPNDNGNGTICPWHDPSAIPAH